MTMKPPSSAVQRTPAHLEWRVSAVTCENSSEFAAALQAELNKSTAEGFSLAQMFVRGPNSDAILVHQRVTLQPASEPEQPIEGMH
jgi:hypothetical protein